MNFNASRYKYPKKQKSIDQLSEQELLGRLVVTVFAIFLIGGGAVASVMFFGPQIGAFFGLISVNRNQKAAVDTTAPEPPIIYDYPEATKESTATIKGYAEPYSTVKLFVNGPEAQSTTADTAGQFSFDSINLGDGKNTIFAKSVDSAGNQSDGSKVIYINVDNQKPKITIDSPKDGDVIRNLDKRILIKGKIDKKGTLTINGKMAVVKPDLTFEFLLGVSEGNVEITFVATDTAGNSKTEKITVTYEKRGA